jgi:ABC-type multidrug transport system fused ATPase/permease subunit
VALARLLRAFLRPHAGAVALVVSLLAVQAAGNLYLPDLNADIINKGVLDGNVGYIWRTGALMGGIALAVGTLSVLAVYCASRVSMQAGASLRAAVYRRVRAFSAEDMQRFGVPSLITRNINDVQQVQMLLHATLTLLVVAVIMSVGGVVMAVREGAALSLLLVVAVPVVALVIAAVVTSVVPRFRSMQIKVDRINQVLREQIAGVRVIRGFLRTRYEEDRFRDVNSDLAGTVLQVSKTFAAAIPLLTVILTMSSVSVLWFGGRLVRDGSMPIGNVTAFLAYTVQILLAVLIAVSIVLQLPHAMASAERIRQVLEAEPGIVDPPRPVTPVRVTGTVEFRNVSFGYPGSEYPVLCGLSFTCWPGQTSAIIGGTGSGKTTLVNLIPRLLDVSDGAVLVNGADVRQQQADELRSAIGLVPQAGYLFRGTVASNLRFGAPAATDEQLWRALEIAQALEFVASMPGQLEAPIDQGGTNVSGGQRQRLAIARALLRTPRLYLFDDCFSALDAATDARLRAALAAEIPDASVIIVAQRVSTIMHADQIIVLEGGRVAGIGRHERLLAGCQPYREIVASQPGQGVAA